MDSGSRIVAIARTWLGTPYHHQASVKGVGSDCLGLVRGVYREAMGTDPEVAPAYSRDWAEASGRETLLEAAARHLTPVALANAAPGDVLIFRMRKGMVAKHAAILASEDTMIHAMEGTLASEVPFSPWWQRRVAGVFRFPKV
jgi:NlpC/P60 family putative phage cell wall peptidase